MNTARVIPSRRHLIGANYLEKWLPKLLALNPPPLTGLARPLAHSNPRLEVTIVNAPTTPEFPMDKECN